jgi:hypothetical protein
MPNFDGKGPLKRGRVIGRGRGPCEKGTPLGEETPCSNKQVTDHKEKTA